VTYFTPHFAPDFANVLEITEGDAEIMRNILETIKMVNDDIRQKHDESLKSKQSNEKVIEAVEGELVEDELGL
jgi:predicted RNase H-like HicB family nuclease